MKHAKQPVTTEQPTTRPQQFTAILKCSCGSYHFNYNANGFQCDICGTFYHEEEAGKHLFMMEDL